MCKGSVSKMVETGKEPTAVLRIHKESRSWAFVVFLGDGKDFGGTIAWSSLSRPDAHFPSGNMKILFCGLRPENILTGGCSKIFAVTTLQCSPVIEDKALRTSIFKDCIIIFVLVELDASVEPAAVLGMAIVTLSGAFQDGFSILSDALNLTLSIYNPHNSEG